MSRSNPHPIRNAVIATVVGGVILAGLSLLWPPATQMLEFLKSAIFSAWRMLQANYLIAGWVLMVMALLAAAAIVHFGVSFRKALSSPAEPSYVQDNIHGAQWQWTWKEGHIRGLWASCPACQGELVYVHDRDLSLMTVPRARYMCEHCKKIIDKKRIKALPSARYCMACQSGSERSGL